MVDDGTHTIEPEIKKNDDIYYSAVAGSDVGTPKGDAMIAEAKLSMEKAKQEAEASTPKEEPKPTETITQPTEKVEEFDAEEQEQEKLDSEFVLEEDEEYEEAEEEGVFDGE